MTKKINIKEISKIVKRINKRETTLSPINPYAWYEADEPEKFTLLKNAIDKIWQKI